MTHRRTTFIAFMLMFAFALCGIQAALGAANAFAAQAPTISGTASITITNKDKAWSGQRARCKAVITLPNGSQQTATGYCISGDSYGFPVDGTYPYTGTLQADGTYAVVIDSSKAKAFNAAAFPAGSMKGTQKMGDIRLSYNPKVTVTFTKTSANAKLTTGNASYSLAGATYDIYDVDTGKKVATITTGADGKASCSLDPNSSYRATEVKAPTGYKLAAKDIAFKTGAKGSAVTLKDQPITVTLKARKRDQTIGDGAQAGYSLAGAQYTICDARGTQHTATTDETGSFTLKGLPLGEVTVTETKAPAGYQLEPAVHRYTASPSGNSASSGTVELDLTNELFEAPSAFDIRIAKFKGQMQGWETQSGHVQPAAGVTFEIASKSSGKTVATITTNKDGFASTSDAACVPAGATGSAKTWSKDCPWFGAGKRTQGVAGALPFDPKGYTVREVASTVPAGYARVEDWDIDPTQIANGSTLQFICNDQRIDTRLQIVKTDAHSGKVIPLAGFSFQILDAKGDAITQTSYYPNEQRLDTFTTDASGMVTLPQRLEPGTYSIAEKAAQPPYLIGKPISFTVDGNHATAKDRITVTVANEQAKGRASIEKRCKLDGKTLAGAEFDVVAQQDVISPDGTVRAVRGQIVDHVATGKDGMAATATDLWLGAGRATYAFVETKAPAGHAIDATPIPFTLTYQDASTSVVHASVKATNAPTTVIIKKTDVSTGEALAGAVFKLTGPKTTDAAALSTDKTGSITIAHLVAGDYSITETKAPAGYVKDDEPRSFTVSANGLITGKATLALAISNDYTKVEISKRDITDEREVEGAKLSIKDSEGNIIESWISGTEDHRIDRLPVGTYTLVEEMTPHAYDQAQEIEFTVEETGEVQKVVMHDEPISITGRIDKRQQIADPTAPLTEANGDGKARAAVTKSEDGAYAYTIDFRNESSTWTDEFTVTDTIDGATEGLAILQAIETPVVQEDFDGLMNVWHQTSLTPADHVDSPNANATRSDKHENPWLDDESTKEALGDDGRVLDYTGWKLWKAGVTADASEKLLVADLDLENGEVVTAVRFEYGRVEAGLTTRDDLWDREDLKDPHDDIDEIPARDEDGPKGAVMHLRVTDAYREGTVLKNAAAVDLYRNGGGEDLESHDKDQVEQAPKAVILPLPQTGTASAVYLVTAIATTIAAAMMAIHIRKQKNRAKGTHHETQYR